MTSPQERLAAARERSGPLDHVIRMVGHYGGVNANQQAGAVTYFAFLSFFPILALAVFVVGILSEFYPQANGDLREAINSVLPGLVGSEEGQIKLDDVRTFTGLAAVVGVLGVLYAGLGWVSALREALVVVFVTPAGERPSFVVGKLRDLIALGVVGATMLVAVAVAGFVAGFSTVVLDLLGLDEELGWVVRLIALALGLAANALLFFALFKLLAEPDVPRRSLVSGAVLGAVGFEILKQVSNLLLASTKGQPAFQAFGIALILLVWINYFSRLVMYAAAWAYTTPAARAERDRRPGDAVQGPATPDLTPLTTADAGGSGRALLTRWVAPFLAGAAAALAVMTRRRRGEDR